MKILIFYTVVPRKCALFFQRLSILERATDHECINNCNHPKEMWVGFICDFFSKRRCFKIQHPHFPAFPPPACFTSSPWYPPPSFPHPPPQAPLLLSGTSLTLGLRQGCSLQRRATHQMRQVRLAYLMGQSRGRIRSELRGAGDDQQQPLPLPRLLWCPWLGTWRQMGMGGGGGVKLGLHMVLHTLKLVLESWLQHTQDLLDVT